MNHGTIFIKIIATYLKINIDGQVLWKHYASNEII